MFSNNIEFLIAVISSSLLVSCASGAAVGRNGLYLHHWQEHNSKDVSTLPPAPISSPTTSPPSKFITENFDDYVDKLQQEFFQDHSPKPEVIDELVCSVYLTPKRQTQCRCILNAVDQFEDNKYSAHQTDELVGQKRSMEMAIKACMVRKQKTSKK